MYEILAFYEMGYFGLSCATALGTPACSVLLVSSRPIFLSLGMPTSVILIFCASSRLMYLSALLNVSSYVRGGSKVPPPLVLGRVLLLGLLLR